MPDIYPNLPGVSVDLVERRQPAEPPAAAGLTQSLLILGTASDGPLFTPVPVSSPEEAEAIFGKAELEGPGKPNLSRACWEAYQAGARDIRLMKISGEYAKAVLPAAQRTVTISAEAREELGPAPGNTETTLQFTLGAADDVLKSVSVTADGLVLAEGDYTVSRTDADVTVTIAAEVTSSGVPVRVDYTYAHVTSTPVTGEQLSAVAGQTNPTQYFSVHRNWDPGAVVSITKNGNPVAPSDYTVDYAAGTVTFVSANLPEDMIVANYSYLAEGDPISGSVSGVTSGADKSFALSNSPEVGSFVLFTVDGPVPQEGYTLSPELKTVVLRKGYVKKGVVVNASYRYLKQVTIGPKIDVQSVGAASLYNDVYVAVQEVYDESGQLAAKEVVVVKPLKKRLLPSEPPLRYSSKQYSTLGELAAAVNADARNNVVRFAASEPSEPTMSLITTNGFVRLSGGDDGLNLTKEQLYYKLEGRRDQDGNIIEHGAYTLLENYDVDHIVLCGLYFDDELAGPPEMNFARQLAQFCAVSSMFQNNVLGYIGVRPIVQPTLAELVSRVNALALKPHEFYMVNVKGELMKDREGNNIPISKYISIVSYPDFVVNHPRLGVYVADPAVAYAARAAAVDPDMGTTQEEIPGVRLRYELSNPLRNTLVGAQYVCFETAAVGGAERVVVTAGVTAAKAGSDYDSLFHMKVANAATDLIRVVSRPYIGKPYSAVKRQAHASDIESALASLVRRGSLADFQFSLYTDVKSRNLRNAVVELTLITNPELRKLHIFVSLQPGA